jgi:hypothetical protein
MPIMKTTGRKDMFNAPYSAASGRAEASRRER